MKTLSVYSGVLLCGLLLLSACNSDDNPAGSDPGNTAGASFAQMAGIWEPSYFHIVLYGEGNRLLLDTTHTYAELLDQLADEIPGMGSMEMYYEFRSDSFFVYYNYGTLFESEECYYRMGSPVSQYDDMMGSLGSGFQMEVSGNEMRMRYSIKEGDDMYEEFMADNPFSDMVGTNEIVTRMDETVVYTRYSGDMPPDGWPAQACDLGDYTATSAEPDSFEPDNTAGSATAVTVGSTVADHTLTWDDTDFFAFSAESGYTYQITTTGNLDTHLSLYSSSQTLVAYDDDDDDNTGMATGLNAVLDWECSETGTYYIKVEGYEAGPYGLTISTGSIAKKGSSRNLGQLTMRKIGKLFLFTTR